MADGPHNAKWWSTWAQNPAVVVSAAIVLSVIALVSAATLGVDHGVLRSMGDVAFARGLITYLFAIVTIGTAVVLVLSAVVADRDGDAADKRFQRGKEILSLLLGVFGTIVGFYFGQQTSEPAKAAGLKLSALNVEQRVVKPGDTVPVRAFVYDGQPPYSFTLTVGGGKASAAKEVPASGWINEPVQVPGDAKDKIELSVTASDSKGTTSTQKIELEPKTQ